MTRTKDAPALTDPVAVVAAGQGALNLVGGLWPLLHRRSFEWVFGSKTDTWLQMTTAGLLVSIGAGQLATALTPRGAGSARMTGLGTAATLLAVDVVCVSKRRIRSTYLLDAVMEAGWLAAWWWASKRRRQIRAGIYA
jgi:hypothetical protein